MALKMSKADISRIMERISVALDPCHGKAYNAGTIRGCNGTMEQHKQLVRADVVMLQSESLGVYCSVTPDALV